VWASNVSQLAPVNSIDMTRDLPPTIDPVAAARWAALPTQVSPWLHEEVARRMEDRLDLIRLQPQAWAHWDAVRGGLQAQALLTKRYPQAQCYVVESSELGQQMAAQALAKPWWNPARWKAVPLNFETPPNASVQMLWANMGLHMAADPQKLIQNWHQALAVDGFLMFSCLGPDSLRELRGLYQAMGWPTPGHAFTDMHDWGDMLVQTGFAEPVMDMERITLTYATPQRLLADLRELGRNLNPQRFAGLRTPRWRSGLEAEIVRHLRPPGDSQGPLTLSFEVIYGHAFKPVPRVRLGDQSAFSLEDMRAMLRTGRGPGG
jgi:malonyl-CoA O-methyltransferase